MNRGVFTNNKPTFRIADIKKRTKQSLMVMSLLAMTGIIGVSQFTTTIASALSIYSVTSSQGPTSGDTEVTITGEGFLKTIDQRDEITRVASADNYSIPTVIALTKGGKVYSIGNNLYGNAGTGKQCMMPMRDLDYSDYPDCIYDTPQDITAQFNGDKIIDVRLHTNEHGISGAFIAIGESGKVYVWGEDTGFINNENNISYTSPTIVSALSNKRVVKFASNLQYAGLTLLITDTSFIAMSENSGPEGGAMLQEFNFTNKLAGRKLKDVNIDDKLGAIILATTDNHLFVVDLRACQPAERASTNTEVLPNCAQLLDITNKLPATASQMFNSLILGVNNNLYALGFNNSTDFITVENTSETLVLPKIKQILSDNLLLTTDGKLVYLHNNGWEYDTTPFMDIVNLDRNGITYVPLEQRDQVCVPTYEPSLMHQTERELLPPPKYQCVKIPLESTTVTVPAINKLSFGNIMTSNFTIVDNNTIIARTPAHPAGKVDVKLYPIDSADETVTLSQGYEYLGDRTDTDINTGEQVIPTAPNTGFDR